MPTSNADRQRRYRQRQRDNRNVVPVEVDFDLVDALIDGGLLRPEKSDDRGEIALAVAAVLRRWKIFRNA